MFHRVEPLERRGTFGLPLRGEIYHEVVGVDCAQLGVGNLQQILYIGYSTPHGALHVKGGLYAESPHQQEYRQRDEYAENQLLVPKRCHAQAFQLPIQPVPLLLGHRSVGCFVFTETQRHWHYRNGDEEGEHHP